MFYKYIVGVGVIGLLSLLTLFAMAQWSELNMDGMVVVSDFHLTFKFMLGVILGALVAGVLIAFKFRDEDL